MGEEGEERERDRENSLVTLLIKTLIQGDQDFTLVISFTTNYFLKVPSPNTVTLGVMASTYEFGGDTNIQSIMTCQVKHNCLFYYFHCYGGG